MGVRAGGRAGRARRRRRGPAPALQAARSDTSHAGAPHSGAARPRPQDEPGASARRADCIPCQSQAQTGRVEREVTGPGCDLRGPSVAPHALAATLPRPSRGALPPDHHSFRVFCLIHPPPGLGPRHRGRRHRRLRSRPHPGQGEKVRERRSGRPRARRPARDPHPRPLSPSPSPLSSFPRPAAASSSWSGTWPSPTASSASCCSPAAT